jgi:signal transduction histidine kinase/CheY-like chemotaxis protein/Tfp pilus assembly protein PilF
MKYTCLRLCAWQGLLLVLLFLIPALTPAQTPALIPESEARLRAATTDSARAMALQLLAFNLAHTDPVQSVAYGKEAHQLAIKTGNAWLVSQCQNGYGWALFSSGEVARARILLDSSLQYMRAIKAYSDQTSVCNNLGWICLKQGDNLGALRYFKEGLEAAESAKDPGRIAFMTRSLGSFYNAQKEYNQSAEYIKRALKMFENQRDTARISECLMSLANAYCGMGKYEKAIEYYKKTLPITQQKGDKLEEGVLWENWGMALGQLGRYDETFEKLENARSVFEQLNERTELAYLENIIGSVYLLKKDTAQAIPALEKALKLSAELQLIDIQTEILPELHRAYYAAGLPEKAYQTLLAYQTLRDTTASEAGKNELQRLKTEFETDRKEKDIQIKTLENKRLLSQFWLALAGLCLALMAGFVFWYRDRQRRKTNAALEAKNAEVLEQKAEAERLRARAEHSEAVKERFLAAMSHEIRTPMNAIVGLSQLLDAEAHEPTVARNISIIRQSGEHLMTILNDVLDLAKIKAEKIELHPQPLALLSHLALVRDTFAGRAREKGIELRIETDENLPQHMLADPVRFGQVLNNLVSNAVKFTDAGEVLIAAQTERLDETMARIKFSVRDTGIGIAPEKQAAIFEEYTQADSSVALQYGGTGLGLSIARALVAQMGGTLQLQSSPGAGSTFFFTLDLPIAAPPAGQISETGKTVIPKLFCKSPVRILLVEDNEFNQIVAFQTVSAICPDINLDVVSRGEQAIALIQTEFFDLILTDLQMPGIDGYETARHLRAAGFERPIVALTASALRTDEQKCIDAGMQEMKLKPISLTEMETLLLRYIPEKLTSNKAQIKQKSSREMPLPPALLHFAGDNPAIARQLLAVIHTELSANLPVFQELLTVKDAAGIRQKVHKMRPQLIALGHENHRALFDAIEHNSDADEQFWPNAFAFEQILKKTLSEI